MLICMMCIFTCSCGSKNVESKNEIKETPETEIETFVNEDLKNKSPFVGFWMANAVIYEGKMIYLSENESLADLYDTDWITISDDYTFSIQNHVFTHNGTWSEVETDEYEHVCYLSHTNTIRYSIDDDGNIEEIKSPCNEKELAILLDYDGGSLVLGEVGKELDKIVVLYTKSNGNDNNESISSKPSFNNKYGTSTTICAYKGCNNYIASSGDTNCCEIHSNMCLKCDKYIDSDAMYCMDCLSGVTDNNSSNISGSHNSITRGEENALKRAKEYLNYQAFSYRGLIEQLEFEGFTNSEATYAVDNCGADWYEQAVLKAEEYLEYSSFSRSGLIEQLEFEGFTSDQAEYAVNQVY